MKKKVTLESLQKEVEELKEMVRQLLDRPNVITITSPAPYVGPMTWPEPQNIPYIPYTPPTTAPGTWPQPNTPYPTC